MVVAAAIVAGMLGGAAVGFGRKKLTYCRPIAGGALQLLQPLSPSISCR